ncbi:MAG: dipeptide ABC transporter ATP-binding protein DppD [Confluentimicrobium sp.]|jgi:peptide/nickel transport system ATP-binding protein|uniref:ABC transporter ATP-binding protein n=1 Tax=Actibacterium sp. TaxID=1872125 RepID=UPI000C502251|nr:ABC transporter ATP-binding protein [Actibacterium sp.]MBC56596.1 dipeptide ABC transporter ATP-binding protein DppD [Actibacterium sp.]
MPEDAPLLQITDLSIRFGAAATNLVDGVSLSLDTGETLCIVGESGCGKSLTALALMGLLPTPPARLMSGTAMFEGRDLLSLSLQELQNVRGDRMAMIFQEPMTSLNPALKVGEQIAEAVRRHKGVSRDAARNRALDMLQKVRIPAPEKRLDEYPHQMSGGMRQRAMIAMAMANDPALLIADEPTTALDVTVQAQVLDLMRQLQDESASAMIMITHDLGVVAEMADKVAVMYAGRIVEAGPVAAVFENPQHPYTIGLMSSMPSLGDRSGKLVTIPGIVPPADAMPEGCRFASRCPFAQPGCALAPPMREFDRGHAVACWRAPLETGVDAPSPEIAGAA